MNPPGNPPVAGAKANCNHVNTMGHEYASWCMDCGERWTNTLHNSPTVVTLPPGFISKFGVSYKKHCAIIAQLIAEGLHDGNAWKPEAFTRYNELEEVTEVEGRGVLAGLEHGQSGTSSSGEVSTTPPLSNERPSALPSPIGEERESAQEFYATFHPGRHPPNQWHEWWFSVAEAYATRRIAALQQRWDDDFSQISRQLDNAERSYLEVSDERDALKTELAELRKRMEEK